ncbi:malonate-semialdehyde dehydrogenase (acetylating)/methylmalonate-semialdehyde dehydrogenase [Glaciihabitans tibetensis]|uniref:Malonate-semialdehyde dehydrogenase (Acetylating)/methylmalonate-semialdehyde dehydrogenase n=1 Tax=Glaciihabitans tibetensis TaxID=1266600 RepID=A0A2T0VJW3_9MICO|nr:aldehyde dehydrogenase family protein [Glaciihabitans tibetensis]PRY70520.1 malonate-semialdehyde dehydrogenase (acetylating)/methylmalonate-semialdehyde dehydrogenase [Glaciihabitans tibetensis]
MTIELPPTPWFLIGAEYGPLDGLDTAPVFNPATGEELGRVPLADVSVVDRAVAAAAEAFPGWSAVPATKRARLLVKLASLIERDADRLAAIITRDNGKATADARAELARAIEHLEASATAPASLAGEVVIDILPGLDSQLVREAIGVCAVVTPFNFPIMTGLIYWTWALASGNTIVIKPSEQAPYAPSALAELVREAGFPDGVVNIVHGGRVVVEALCDHADVASVSLVGSSATALAVYARAAATGKRAQAAGGARNPLVVLPDADLDTAADAITASVFAMAGQRCLSSSLLVAVGDIHDDLVDRIASRARSLVVAAGTDPASQVPPMISRAAVDAVSAAITAAVDGGATVLVDGRTAITPDGGYLLGPTVLTDIGLDNTLVVEETFGPLLAVVRVATLDEAIAFVNSSPFGNAASLFTRDGASARRFAVQADVGNVGINVGVAAPTAQVGFGGRRKSFVGTVHSQGKHAIEFFTDIKSVSTRW